MKIENRPYQLVAISRYLNRNHDEKRHRERAVIADFGRRQRQEFAQREERDEREHRNRRVAAEQERRGEDADHPPPGAHARNEIVDDGRRLLVLDPRAQDASDHRGDDQQGDHTADEPIKLV
jgi:hypothetical protein